MPEEEVAAAVVFVFTTVAGVAQRVFTFGPQPCENANTLGETLRNQNPGRSTLVSQSFASIDRRMCS